MAVGSLRLERFVALLGLLAWGCQSQVSARLDHNVLSVPGHDIVLGFDLRSDQDPTAVLVISQNEVSSESAEAKGPLEQSVVWLPIGGRDAELDGALVGAVGMYSTFTIATVLASTEGRGNFVAYFSPFVAPFTGDILNPNDLSGDLYLIREGLRRTFLYRLGGVEDRAAWAVENLGTLPVRGVDAIALALPEGSEGREVARGRTSVPDMLHEANGLRFYPAAPDNRSGDFLQVGYVVQPSGEARALAILAGKVVGGLFLPVITLILLSREEAKSPNARRVGLTLLVTAQVGLLGVLVWFGWSSGFEGVKEPLMDLIPVLTGAGAQVAVILSKRPKGGIQKEFFEPRVRRPGRPLYREGG